MMNLPNRRLRKYCYRIFIIGIIVFVVYTWFIPCDIGYKMVPRESVHYMRGKDNKTYPYDRHMPIIFIGGVPRSGTTLMRVMLDAHPDVRCGEETRIIPRVLSMRSNMAHSSKEMQRLKEAGITEEVLDGAMSVFILEIIAKHAEAAPFLCNKDPFTLKASVYLSRMFPNSKFVLMIRDGRAVVHSIISRKVTISGFNLKSYRESLKKWSEAVEQMYYQCLRVGSARCMPVYYEQLVLHPEEWMRKIMEFLAIPWHDSVLNHQDYVGKPGGISLSRTEKSTDQVIKPVNVEALTRWVGKIPVDVVHDMPKIAPMLARFGYNPRQNPPDYGKPDQMVAHNMEALRRNKEFWDKREQEILSKGLKINYGDATHGPSDNNKNINMTGKLFKDGVS
ncbi:protein-tyrosine sulfotransferase 1-like [Tubulanus polymorphus]|uniref:protein-tyrosine sulfotransferase 1-like n=1 Tax=Tubulanus polymorphus TaxID=672921 RepID=UPI003DA62057